VLFNSYEFLFAFLPATAAGFFLLARASRVAAATWLALASIAFYGWWNPAYVPLLIASITGNYLFGRAIAGARSAGRDRSARGLLVTAIVLNLALLAYYKYAGFLVTNLNQLAGTGWSLGDIILPLGISFFTFTQIAFLVDVHQDKAREFNFIHFVLFVTYFPHLIAGPVLHHKEMMPQFGAGETYRIRASNVAVGLTIFFIGLFKKTVLADGVAQFVGPVFAGASRGETLSLLDAWGGALAYTLQLYFDFSGYSDMAIGLSRLFGIRLPLNFDSPYKAVNIIDFWRRWHMTLSRFLRDYLYIPLGGSRNGRFRRYVNLALTMVLGGLWHGAGWTFVIWGALHGFYLIVNHAWHAMRAAAGIGAGEGSAWGRAGARTVTLLAVIVGWVFFRADTVATAERILLAMAGANGATIPAGIVAALGPLQPLVEQFGIVPTPGGGSRLVAMWLWIGALLPIALFAPNTQQIMRDHDPALDMAGSPGAAAATPVRLTWTPSPRWAWVIGLAGACGVLALNQVSEFLYFQF
jgi:D-alanyl-lipoteichoic acid acyltransferase DltB (MBOAT superfamily)